MNGKAEAMDSKTMGDILKQQWSGPMSEKEKAFLRDVQGLIAFGIRNGLSFKAIARVIHADLSHFARNESSFEEALADGYLPMVTGYSNLTPESFGGFEEEETASN